MCCVAWKDFPVFLAGDVFVSRNRNSVQTGGARCSCGPSKTGGLRYEFVVRRMEYDNSVPVCRRNHVRTIKCSNPHIDALIGNWSSVAAF